MMNRQVWKTFVPIDGDWHELEIGKIVHVDCQHPAAARTVEVWFENEPMSVRRFIVVGTGHPIPEGTTHVGTSLNANGRLVWHLYEDVAF